MGTDDPEITQLGTDDPESDGAPDVDMDGVSPSPKVTPSRFGKRLKRRDSWQGYAFGAGSLFDIEVRSAQDLPFDLPLKTYFEETLRGMKSAPGGKGHPPTEKWKHLRHVLDCSMARDYCEKLFWVLVSVLTRDAAAEDLRDVFDEQAVAELREQMARVWFLLTLKLGHQSTETHDWLALAMPVVFVQAIYRLLVDAFPPDRAKFIECADVLIDKMTHILHYEAAGFQSNAETWRKIRQQMFRPHVIESPWTNNNESMRNEQRLEKLQSQNQKRQLQPLDFGKELSRPLEEVQLEHIMELRNQDVRTSSKGKPLTRSALNFKLNELAHYADLSQKGEDLYTEQVLELYNNIPSTTAHYSERATLYNTASPFGPNMRCTVSDDLEESADEGLSSLGNTLGNTGNIRTQRSSGGRSSKLEAEVQRRERRENEAAERRRRDEVLHAMLAAPLPLCYRVRELNTGHVSPMIDQLAPSEADRGLLQKQGHNVQKVKMRPPNPRMLPSLAPVEPEDPKYSATHTEDEHSDAISRSTTQTLPKIARATSEALHLRTTMEKKHDTAGRASLKHVKLDRVINLESPAMLDKRVVERRLEEQNKASKSQSFDQYKRSYDLVTGVRKQFCDEARLKGDERCYVQRLESLLGSRSEPSLRLPRFHLTAPSKPRRPHVR